jgi:Molecular chaperone (small heat shock protein)
VVEEINNPDKNNKTNDIGKEKQASDRIAQLEKRIRELEKGSSKAGSAEPDIQVQGIVENVVGQFIPGLGGIIKALEASSPEFRQRIADTDAEIKHRIDVGWSSKPVVDYHFSTRPIRHGPDRSGPRQDRTERVNMPDAPTREPIVDILEGKDGLTVIAELPGVSEDDLKISLEGESLEIDAGSFNKKISLPYAAKGIKEKSYKNGILQIKLN